jgi:hypothetical protein
MSAVAESVWHRSTPLVSSAEWLRDALAELERIRNLERDWNTYGSPPITQSAGEATHDLILRLAERWTTRPEVRPVSGGGLQLEWGSGGRELELMISPNGTVFFMVLLRDGQTFDGKLEPAFQADLGADLASALFPKE